MTDVVLRIEDLNVSFATRLGTYPAVAGVDLELRAGETLCIVGESGCGKSVTALSILRLLPEPPARIERGAIWFREENLLAVSPERLRAIRGRSIAMIFQEPMTSLNPVLRVGEQIDEVLVQHTELGRSERKARVVELLEQVGLPEAARRASAYPHELSGGMRQRVMIAMALACDPTVLIADEPTTALDVTVQAQILDLIADLKRQRSMAVLLITHDLGVVAETAQRVAVFYAGRVAEIAHVAALFRAPRHPYTVGLMRALPSAQHPAREPLEVIRGSVPDLAARPDGCLFQERCERAQAKCRSEEPVLIELTPEHWVACHDPYSEAASQAEFRRARPAGEDS